MLDLLHLQGVGPKTAATLYRELGIRTLEELQQAATDGRIRSLRGMGAKKEALILKALDERARYAGRHLVSDAQDAADALVAFLRERAPGASIDPVGSLRRGCDTCGDLDLLACGADRSLMDDFVGHPLAERVLGHGDTKSSVLLRGGFQADLRLVEPDSRGAAMQYFTGSKAHNIALRDRAIDLGYKLNEYGLFRIADDTRVAGASEEDVYQALGLAWIPPELREAHGEIEAAAEGRLPHLIARADLRGDLHMHSTETDGRDDVRTMAAAAREAGLEYIAITDHSQSLAMANGLDERRAVDHAARIRALDREIDQIRILAGIECDIRPDGTLDLDDDCLASLDVVVASVHSAFNQDRAQMTDRILRAMENPHVDILGHPTGRYILKRDPVPGRRRSGRRSSCPTRGGARNQLAAPSPRSQRRLCPAGARPWRASRDLERCPLAPRLCHVALGDARRAPRLARAERRLEHPGVLRLPGTVEAQSTMKLPMLSLDQKLAEIKRLYFRTTRSTIDEDLARALDLLKSMATEEERERATVYMEGLAQMRKDWSRSKPVKGRPTKAGE